MKKKICFFLIGIIMTFSCFSCRTNPSRSNADKIGFICNEQFHLLSIPRPCKQVEIYPNGSISLQKVMITNPDGAIISVEKEGISTRFFPEEPGSYQITYEYTYTNHFEHLTIETKPSTWEKGSFVLNVEEIIIPNNYKFVTSQNQLISLYYPPTISSNRVPLIMVYKPLPCECKVELNIPDFGNFPEAYTLSGKQEVRILCSHDKKTVLSGIQINLRETANTQNTLDTLSFSKNIPFSNTPIEEISTNQEDISIFLNHCLYFIENGDLFLWDFQNHTKILLLSGYDFATLSRSPDRKQIALSTKTDTFLCNWEGKNCIKIGEGLIHPTFSTNDTLWMVQATNWPTASSTHYSEVIVTNNVYSMPLQMYSVKQDILSSRIYIAVCLGDRWSMYYPTFADLPIEMNVFDRGDSQYLLYLASPGLEPKWVGINGTQTQEGVPANTPWIPTKAYIQKDFSYEGDILNTICKDVTYSTGLTVLFRENMYAELSLPEDTQRYVAFLRTVKDQLSAPQFYVEVQQELCVFDKTTKIISRLPVEDVSALLLGI